MKNVTGTMKNMVKAGMMVLAGILSAIILLPANAKAASLPTPGELKFNGVYVVAEKDCGTVAKKIEDTYNVREYLNLDESKILAIRYKDGRYEICILDGMDYRKDIVLSTPEEQKAYGLEIVDFGDGMNIVPITTEPEEIPAA